MPGSEVDVPRHRHMTGSRVQIGCAVPSFGLTSDEPVGPVEVWRLDIRRTSRAGSRIPFGRHEARWLPAGSPTKLVRDGSLESYDDPPDEEPTHPAATH